MSGQKIPLDPIRTDYRLDLLNQDQLNQLQAATLEILDQVGVRFPSEKALSVFADHSARVDWQNQIVKLSPDLVRKALSTVPRYYSLGARDPEYDLQLQPNVTYFTTDGCGVETVEFESGLRRPSRKSDVGMMAQIADYLPSIAFYWPMVSAQDFGVTAPLHELDASWNNTIKHVQSETVMGEIPARYAVEMATILAGDREALRRRPLFSLVVCTIAPLTQDKDGIEAAMVLAEAGVPVGFLAMPTLGTTATATLAGAYAMGDAEIISAVVLTQLVAPGAPTFHSLMHAWADPHTGGYVTYSLDSSGRYAPVEMAHHWGLPVLGGAYGTDATRVGAWQEAAEVSLDPLLACLSGAEMVTGIGLSETFTLLYPEQIILDDDLLNRARYHLKHLVVNPETLALEVIRNVGPGGHFLAQKHTREHMRHSLKRTIANQLNEENHYIDPVEAARQKFDWIRKNHQPEALDAQVKAEFERLLAAADLEISRADRAML
jgi:trimethylamine:corrinoid methyltransferase-like protein